MASKELDYKSPLISISGSVSPSMSVFQSPSGSVSPSVAVSPSGWSGRESERKIYISTDKLNEITTNLTEKYEAKVNAFTSEVEERLKKIEDNQTENSTKLTDNFDNKINKKTAELDEKQIRIIETLGIFFALFTFISINVQIFSRISDLISAVIFSLLLFCVLVLMITISDYLLMTKEKNWVSLRHLVILSLIGLIAFVSISFLIQIKPKLNPVENTSQFNEAVDKRIQEKYYDKDQNSSLIEQNKLVPTILPTQILRIINH